jgi:hypothetical protein
MLSQPSPSKIQPDHLDRDAVIYTLSRDFVGYPLALYATFARLCIAQGNWLWTLQQPLKRCRGSRVCVNGYLANAIKITR